MNKHAEIVNVLYVYDGGGGGWGALGLDQR